MKINSENQLFSNNYECQVLVLTPLESSRTFVLVWCICSRPTKTSTSMIIKMHSCKNTSWCVCFPLVTSSQYFYVVLEAIAGSYYCVKFLKFQLGNTSVFRELWVPGPGTRAIGVTLKINVILLYLFVPNSDNVLILTTIVFVGVLWCVL